MVFNSDELLAELKTYVQHHIDFAKSLLKLSDDVLQSKSNEKSWSALECLEHLNLYGDFYVPEITNRLQKSKSKNQSTFKSGFLGNKFAMDMLPKEGMKTMNTFKSKNPINSNLDKEKVILRFINKQEKMLELLSISSNKNLSKIKTSITLPLLKFKLGDTFRFVIYHNERHIVQAKRALKNVESSF